MQVALGYDYLKNTLRLAFPDAQAATAQREQEQREGQVCSWEFSPAWVAALSWVLLA